MAIDSLAKLAAEYHRSVARSAEARDSLHTAIIAALAAGRTQADIVRVTGYTRERIRQITKEAE